MYCKYECLFTDPSYFFILFFVFIIFWEKVRILLDPRSRLFWNLWVVEGRGKKEEKKTVRSSKLLTNREIIVGTVIVRLCGPQYFNNSLGVPCGLIFFVFILVFFYRVNTIAILFSRNFRCTLAPVLAFLCLVIFL